MSKKTTKPLFASGLYIALSLCLLAVVCVGAYSAINQFLQKPLTDTTPELGGVEDFSTPTDISQENTSPDVPVINPDIPESDENIVDESAAAEQESTEEEVSAEPQETPRIFMSPVASGEISKIFQVEELLYSQTMNDYRAHTGIDFAAEVGAAVCAFTDGVVESIHPDPLMGQTIILDHGNGLKSIYQNLSLEIPEGIIAGAEVHAGDLIGAVGESALIECAEPTHLHFEVEQDGVCIDPEQYLNTNA